MKSKIELNGIEMPKVNSKKHIFKLLGNKYNPFLECEVCKIRIVVITSDVNEIKYFPEALYNGKYIKYTRIIEVMLWEQHMYIDYHLNNENQKIEFEGLILECRESYKNAIYGEKGRLR